MNKSPELLHPGKVISLAHASNPANWSRQMAADYTDEVERFLGLLQSRGITFVIVGGIALLKHVQGRNTEDIDIIISAPRLTELPELSISDRNEMFAEGHFESLRVDLLFLEHPFFERIQREFSTELEYAIGRLPTATIDGLILMKLFALPSLYRQFDLDRIAIYESDLLQLLGRSSHGDDFFLNILREYTPESDLRQLAALLRDLRQRLQRIKRGSSAG